MSFDFAYFHTAFASTFHNILKMGMKGFLLITRIEATKQTVLIGFCRL